MYSEITTAMFLCLRSGPRLCSYGITFVVTAGRGKKDFLFENRFVIAHIFALRKFIGSNLFPFTDQTIISQIWSSMTRFARAFFDSRLRSHFGRTNDESVIQIILKSLVTN